MKKKMVKLLVILSLVAVSIFYLDAVIAMNDPVPPFPKNVSMEVGDMITDSASELLQSAAEAFLFLNEVEVAEKRPLNVGAALQRVDMAAARIEQSLRMFKDIIAVGGEASCEPKRIHRLKEFAYERFARENGLNVETMADVSSYLKRGNVLGFYRRHARNLHGLL
ncbi:MAG: hypothetical protein JXO51_10185, partial [Candidatus Aminicenantes bacterium]|nr:hypothetical protein [Candidatus Aminicenantes bacterium]